MASSRPTNVGILAMDIYFPPTCVTQEALEGHDGVSKGKYTIGLGQDCMAFCSEVEDVISMSLTVVASLLEKFNVDPKQIGRLEVGSETVIDKSKSIKTFLMQVFEASGNTDIEGVDSTNACYGGTAALFNCVNWVESSSWDGRYGLVVCTDSAVYAEGPARPTGGAAAIAMLVGPDAPIAFESKLRGSHMSHAYDFYKPNLASEYPVVDGKLSQTCYLMALDSCYRILCEKFEKLEGRPFSISDSDYFVFHSPYNKLVQKSFGRLYFNDFMRNLSFVDEAARETLAPYASLSGDESYQSRDLEKANQQAAKHVYDEKVQPSTLIPKQVGNMYTASLYAAFASLLHNKNTSLVGKRVVLFSYGSGLTATMFSLRFQEGQHPFNLSNIVTVMNVSDKLKQRLEIRPEEFVETLKIMEHRYGGKDFVTSKDCSYLPPGTFYLTSVDSMYRRYYAKKDKAENIISDTVLSASKFDPKVPARILRMFFHDCFIRGCDASILLDSTPKNLAEKDGPPNLSVHSFYVIDEAKTKLEKACPHTVSCADIIAIAARDVVAQSGGPSWNVLKGRKDGRVSKASETVNLPAPTLNVNQLIQSFAKRGLGVKDMVTLSGGHTLGFSHCSSFQARVHNFSLLHAIDPSLNTEFALDLIRKCPKVNTNPNAGHFLDSTSSVFDNDYYRQLLVGKGLFSSDESLVGDQRTRWIVEAFAKDQGLFFGEFVASMLKLGNVGVSENGEVRLNCKVVN